MYSYLYIYIYIFVQVKRGPLLANVALPNFAQTLVANCGTMYGICGNICALKQIRSVFKISCLFLRPRLWQFEI